MASRTFSALAALVGLGLLLPAGGVQSRGRARREGALGQRQALLRRKVHQLQEILHWRMPQLRRAVWDELGLAPQQPLTEDLADAARELLAREADYLAAEDNFAASLLHDYARSALVPALSYEPFAELAEPEQPTYTSSAESEETALQRNAEGQLVRTVRRCKGNRCVTMEEVQPEAEVEPKVEAEQQPGALHLVNEAGAQSQEELEQLLEEEALSAEELAREEEAALEEAEADPEEVAYGAEESADEVLPVEDTMDAAMASAANTVGSAVRVVARNMAKDLKNVMEGSGLPPLSNIVDKVMNSTFVQDIAKSISSGNSTEVVFNISGGGEGAGNALVGFGKAFKDLFSKFAPGNLSNISSAIGSPLLGAESVSSVSTVENGHVVRRVRRCSQGKCITTMDEGEDSAFPFGHITDELMDGTFGKDLVNSEGPF